MRFVLIGPVHPYRGGIAHYTTRLHQTLHERGHDLFLISFKRQYPPWLFPGPSDRDPSEKPLQVQDAHYWIDSLNPLTWLTTFWRIRAYRPDAIIQQWWTPFWAPAWFLLGALNRFLLKRPLVIICHNVLPHEARRWDPLVGKMVLRWGTHCIAQSREEKEKLLALIPKARVSVYPHPVYDILADQKMSKQQAREHLGLPQDVPVLLFFGIVREYKGLDDILVALPKIRARLERVMLVVAGEFWDRKEPYLETIRRLGIENSVVIEDRYIPNEQVGIYFSAADVLVAPYRRVTGSGVVQMARGFQVPVVTSGIGWLAEAADDETALLVPPADPDALAAAVIRYFEGNLLPALPGKAWEKDCSWDRLAEAIESSIQDDQAAVPGF